MTHRGGETTARSSRGPSSSRPSPVDFFAAAPRDERSDRKDGGGTRRLQLRHGALPQSRQDSGSTAASHRTSASASSNSSSSLFSQSFVVASTRAGAGAGAGGGRGGSSGEILPDDAGNGAGKPETPMTPDAAELVRRTFREQQRAAKLEQERRLGEVLKSDSDEPRGGDDDSHDEDDSASTGSRGGGSSSASSSESSESSESSRDEDDRDRRHHRRRRQAGGKTKLERDWERSRKAARAAELKRRSVDAESFKSPPPGLGDFLDRRHDPKRNEGSDAEHDGYGAAASPVRGGGGGGGAVVGGGTTEDEEEDALSVFRWSASAPIQEEAEAEDDEVATQEEGQDSRERKDGEGVDGEREAGFVQPAGGSSEEGKKESPRGEEEDRRKPADVGSLPTRSEILSDSDGNQRRIFDGDSVSSGRKDRRRHLSDQFAREGRSSPSKQTNEKNEPTTGASPPPSSSADDVLTGTDTVDHYGGFREARRGAGSDEGSDAGDSDVAVPRPAAQRRRRSSSDRRDRSSGSSRSGGGDDKRNQDPPSSRSEMVSSFSNDDDDEKEGAHDHEQQHLRNRRGCFRGLGGSGRGRASSGSDDAGVQGTRRGRRESGAVVGLLDDDDERRSFDGAHIDVPPPSAHRPSSQPLSSNRSSASNRSNRSNRSSSRGRRNPLPPPPPSSNAAAVRRKDRGRRRSYDNNRDDSDGDAYADVPPPSAHRPPEDGGMSSNRSAPPPSSSSSSFAASARDGHKPPSALRNPMTAQERLELQLRLHRECPPPSAHLDVPPPGGRGGGGGASVGGGSTGGGSLRSFNSLSSAHRNMKPGPSILKRGSSTRSVRSARTAPPPSSSSSGAADAGAGAVTSIWSIESDTPPGHGIAQQMAREEARKEEELAAAAEKRRRRRSREGGKVGRRVSTELDVDHHEPKEEEYARDVEEEVLSGNSDEGTIDEDLNDMPELTDAGSVEGGEDFDDDEDRRAATRTDAMGRIVEDATEAHRRDVASSSPPRAAVVDAGGDERRLRDDKEEEEEEGTARSAASGSTNNDDNGIVKDGSSRSVFVLQFEPRDEAGGYTKQVKTVRGAKGPISFEHADGSRIEEQQILEMPGSVGSSRRNLLLGGGDDAHPLSVETTPTMRGAGNGAAREVEGDDVGGDGRDDRRGGEGSAPSPPSSSPRLWRKQKKASAAMTTKPNPATLLGHPAVVDRSPLLEPFPDQGSRAASNRHKSMRRLLSKPKKAFLRMTSTKSEPPKPSSIEMDDGGTYGRPRSTGRGPRRPADEESQQHQHSKMWRSKAKKKKERREMAAAETFGSMMVPDLDMSYDASSAAVRDQRRRHPSPPRKDPSQNSVVIAAHWLSEGMADREQRHGGAGGGGGEELRASARRLRDGDGAEASSVRSDYDDDDDDGLSQGSYSIETRNTSLSYLGGSGRGGGGGAWAAASGYANSGETPQNAVPRDRGTRVPTASRSTRRER